MHPSANSIAHRHVLAPTAIPYHVTSAFTLVELLVVIGIMGLLMALAGPLLSSFKGSGDLNKASYDIQSLLEQARSYALANNTYVYVGLQEVDVIQASLSTPVYSNGVGRVAMAVVASTTGMRPYSGAPINLTTASITPISKLRYFDNLHITNSASLASGTNMTSRPGQPNSTISSSSVIDLSSLNGSSPARTSFSWPLSGTTTNYNFANMVIEFSPRGLPTVQTNSAAYDPSIKQYLEIALMPTHGNTAVRSSNQAAIQINGITGTTQLYRP